MPTHERTVGRAVLLGGAATAVGLCACATLTGAALFLLALCTLDEGRTAWVERGYPMCVGAALVACWIVSLWFGWTVGRDWLRSGR
jgi:hypothetical protein